MAKLPHVIEKRDGYVIEASMGRRVYPEWSVVGERLGWIERALGLSGSRIAGELGITRQRWSSYRLGLRELPISLAGEIRKRWGCALDWIYLGEEYHNAEGFKQQLAEARRKAAQGNQAGGPPARGTQSKVGGPSRA
jgi:transcriptional regulator with XRE-family HTH domain